MAGADGFHTPHPSSNPAGLQKKLIFPEEKNKAIQYREIER